MAPLDISLQPVTLADVPTIAKIGADAFLADRHTQMKALGKNPYDLEAVSREGLPSKLASKNCVNIKAVDNATGEIAGAAAFAFRGFAEGEVPLLVDPIPLPEQVGPTEEKSEEETEEDDDDDVIKRLIAHTDANLNEWTEKLMPPGVKCMFVAGLNVAPKYQKQGVGSTLLSWGNEVADRFGVYIWVPSSEPAWGAYAKSGFEVVGTFDVDLDAWAPAPPPKEEGEGAIWGHYVFRYMKRNPRPKAETA